MINLLDKVEF